MTGDELEQLKRDVQYLKDRTEILDCISRHARGNDRHDVEITSSTYHDDGVDEHGSAVIRGPEYAAWANSAASGQFGVAPPQHHDASLRDRRHRGHL